MPLRRVERAGLQDGHVAPGPRHRAMPVQADGTAVAQRPAQPARLQPLRPVIVQWVELDEFQTHPLLCLPALRQQHVGRQHVQDLHALGAIGADRGNAAQQQAAAPGRRQLQATAQAAPPLMAIR